MATTSKNPGDALASAGIVLDFVSTGQEAGDQSGGILSQAANSGSSSSTGSASGATSTGSSGSNSGDSGPFGRGSGGLLGNGESGPFGRGSGGSTSSGSGGSSGSGSGSGGTTDTSAGGTGSSDSSGSGSQVDPVRAASLASLRDSYLSGAISWEQLYTGAANQGARVTFYDENGSQVPLSAAQQVLGVNAVAEPIQYGFWEEIRAIISYAIQEVEAGVERLVVQVAGNWPGSSQILSSAESLRNGVAGWSGGAAVGLLDSQAQVALSQVNLTSAQ